MLSHSCKKCLARYCREPSTKIGAKTWSSYPEELVMEFRILPQAWVSVSGKLERSEWNNKNPELGTQSSLSYSLDCDLGQVTWLSSSSGSLFLHWETRRWFSGINSVCCVFILVKCATNQNPDLSCIFYNDVTLIYTFLFLYSLFGERSVLQTSFCFRGSVCAPWFS